jgi:hypothetical protein
MLDLYKQCILIPESKQPDLSKFKFRIYALIHYFYPLFSSTVGTPGLGVRQPHVSAQANFPSGRFPSGRRTPRPGVPTVIISTTTGWDEIRNFSKKMFGG